MALESGMLEELKEFMRLRQQYLTQKNSSVVSSGNAVETNEPQPFVPTQPEVPPLQPSQGSGFHVIPLPNDLQLNLAKCVKEEGMKVLTPETVFLQHAIREITTVKVMLEQFTKLFSGMSDNSTRSPLLPVAQDDHAFRPIEVKETEQVEKPVPSSRGGTKKKRDAGNRRSTKNRKS